MDKHFYLISDAAKTLKVETHVLRYWEEELGLSIPRNTWDTAFTMMSR